MSALRQPLPADGRTEFTIDPAKATTVGLSGVRLQVGDEDVVLQAFGSERWIPGPGRHGAMACVWESGYLVLRDPRDRALLAVAGLFEDQAAQIGAAFTACGGSYSSRPLLTDLGVSLSPESSVNLGRGDTGDPTSLSVGLMDTATVILTLGAAIAAAAHPWATPLLLLPLGIIALRVQGGLRLLSWRRHQSRPAGA